MLYQYHGGIDPSYAFPPFAVTGKVLHKIVFDVATVIIVAPA